MLCEELPRHKSIVPDFDDTAVIDGKAQFGESHVQFVHANK
jgi:hypothetical protein